MQLFKNEIAQLADSPAKQRISAHLEATQLFIDVQHNVRERETWDAQDAITGYFTRRDDVIARLDNVDQYVQQGKVILQFGR